MSKTVKDYDIEALRERVHQFGMLALPGQPQMMHMGTSRLVNDLWRALLAADAMLAEEQED